jgi:hypothetical protein
MAAKLNELIAEMERVESALESFVRQSMIATGETEEPADSVTESASAVRQQIADAMLKRGNENIEAVYRKYANDGCGICKKDFFDALYHVRLEEIKPDDADMMFDNMDMDNNGLLDLNEFRRAVSARSSFEQFIAQAIPFSELISTSLPRKKATDQLTTFMELTSAQISKIVRAISAELESLLTAKAKALRESYEAAAAKQISSDSASSASKFSVLELKAGNITDYHNGLSGRVGEHMLIFCLCFFPFVFSPLIRSIEPF